MNIYETLKHVQQHTNAPKNEYNSFGNYSYRSAEAIMQAVKPALDSCGALITLSDEITQQADRIYVKSTATLYAEDGTHLEVSAFAREPLTRKGMDDSQVTGSAASYARKYALSGLLLLDDNKDPDALDNRPPEKPKKKAQPKAKELPQDESTRKAAGEEFLGMCSKYGLVAAYVARGLGLEGKPSADQFDSAVATLQMYIDTNQVPNEWKGAK